MGEQAGRNHEDGYWPPGTITQSLLTSIPIPNVIAGGLIGALSESWMTVLVTSIVIWPLIWAVLICFGPKPITDSGKRVAFSRATWFRIELGAAAAAAVPSAALLHLVFG